MPAEGLVADLVGHIRGRVEVAAGGTTAVVGPNGAGKTSLLRALAGLPSVIGATATLDGVRLDGLPPHRRRVGWVPQDSTLFPHLDVRGNVAFGLPRREQRDAAAWLERLGVADLAARRPTGLSGGQAQRVALARALAARPRLLLLDEPASAIDGAARPALRHLLREVLADFDGVCLLVTHDPVDAITVADHVLALEDGRIVQHDPAGNLLAHPRSAWVARMFGWNAWSGDGTEQGVRLPGDFLLVAAEPVSGGGSVLARVDPAAVAVHTQRPSGSPRNAWRGRVVELLPSGTRLRVRLSGLDGGPDVVAEVTPQAVASLGLAEGVVAWVSVKATEVSVAPI